MTAGHEIDCVLVGRNYSSAQALFESARRKATKSGEYRHIRANTVMHGGERISYMDLLNRTLRAVNPEHRDFHAAELPNLGVIYLASHLRRRGFSAAVVNCFNEEKERLAELLRRRPRCVAISTTFYSQAEPIVEIVRFVRERCPTTKIVAGGPHIFNIFTYYDERTQRFLFKQMGADVYVHEAQGEHTLATIVEALRTEGEAGLARVSNLAYTEDGGVHWVRTGRDVENNCLDENSIQWSGFERGLITPLTILRTSRGCPFSCSFCTYPHHAGRFTQASLQTLERELHALREQGTTHLLFSDDTVNVPLGRFKELLRMMIRNRFGFRWFSHYRCTISDDESVALMAESGCLGVDMGIESGDPRILENMNKAANVEGYRRAIPRLKAHGITTYADLIVGFPGETSSSVRNTIDFVNEVGPDYFHVELYIHMPTAPIARRADEFAIQGGGYSWRHRTMDWTQACDELDRMYDGITASTVLPRQNFGAFTIPYLHSRGVAPWQYARFLQTARKLATLTRADVPIDTAPFDAELERIFRGWRSAPIAGLTRPALAAQSTA